VLGETPQDELDLLAQTAAAASAGADASPAASGAWNQPAARCPLMLDERGRPLLFRVDS
jgi:hypothetical protein